eukprot:1769900-Pyramimonas_sp.AAC.1
MPSDVAQPESHAEGHQPAQQHGDKGAPAAARRCAQRQHQQHSQDTTCCEHRRGGGGRSLP